MADTNSALGHQLFVLAPPSIQEIYPEADATDALISVPVHVIFDQEVDTSTVEILIEGPDTDRWSGAVQTRFDDPTTTADDDLLETPGYHGIVNGELSFVNVDEDGDEVDLTDTTGDGFLWRTKAIFTPDEALAADTEYRVYVIGSDKGGTSYTAGVSRRTIFDAIADAGNSGDGNVYFSGNYTGIQEDTYYVKILGTGDTGDVNFRWWKTSDALITHDVRTRRSSQLLDKGVYVRFENTDWVANDQYTVVVKPAHRMVTTYYWDFTTGAGNIEEIPDSVSSPAGVFDVSGIADAGSGVATDTFEVDSVSPDEYATNLDPDDYTTVTVTFNNAVDQTTLSGNVTVWAEPVNGDTDSGNYTYVDPITTVLSASGAVLTISLQEDDELGGPLFENNAVYVKLGKNIADTDGNTLGADFTYYYTTTYSPLYSAVRRVRLELGPVVSEIPDDTINFALFEASLEADALTFTTSVSLTGSALTFFQWARRQFVTCVAELILLNAISGNADTGAKTKRLADLSISYHGSVDELIGNAIACRMKFERMLTSAGEMGPGTGLKPQMVIKGKNDPDRPNFGRDWESASTYGSIDSYIPAANARSKRTTRRRWKRDYRQYESSYDYYKYYGDE